MTDKPILFSASMIRALLDGRKTQTRRVIKPQPPSGCDRHCWFSMPIYGFTNEPTPTQNWHKVRTFAPGDRLWVRETFQTAMSDNGPCWLYRADSDRIYPEFDGPDEGAGPSFNYEKYPGDYSPWAADVESRGPWRSPIHMPRFASRLTLAVTDVRVQRLAEISEADAVLEGVEPQPHHPGRWVTGDGLSYPTARGAYEAVWNSIHGPGAWEANHWVAALTFRVIHANIDSTEATAA